VQVMHAGTGIVHAEYNREATPTRLFQIWIQPDRHGAAPGWGTRQFPRAGGLSVLASGRAEDADTGALPLNADAAVLAGTLRAGETARLALAPGRGLYLVPASGSVSVTGDAAPVTVGARDGAAITGETAVSITATSDSELVVVNVAA
jgi:redox-sensitive bicupin YhaK (pirin superfamily)